MVKNLAIRGAYMQIPSVFAVIHMRKTPSGVYRVTELLRDSARTEAGWRTFPASPP
jgi:hypothetical protein